MNALSADGSAHGVMDHNQDTGMSVEICVNQIIQAMKKNKREVMV